MRTLFILTLSSFISFSSFGAGDAAAGPSSGYSKETYASLGSSFAQNSKLAQLGWTDAQMDAFIEGLRATFHGRPLPFTAEAAQLQEAVGQRVQELIASESRAFFTDPARLEMYMKERVKQYRLQRSDSGLAFGLMAQRGGSRPGPEDTVVISLTAVAADAQTEIPGLKIENRRMHVSDLLPGLAEGVQMMAAGSTGMFVVPPALSYGDGAWPDGVERGTPIIFTVKLHEVVVAE